MMRTVGSARRTRLGGSGAVPRASRPLRVCLVRPPVVTAPRTLSYYGAVPPLGLAYVAAAAREAGHVVHVVDGAGEALDRIEHRRTPVGTLAWQGLSIDAIAARVPDGVDAIGIGLTFLHEWPTVNELALALRRRHPRAAIVAGGETATAYAEHILAECGAIDACVLGEGEVAFTGLLEALAAGASIASAASTATRAAGGAIVQTPRAPRIRDLDALPWPAWDLFPLERYLERHQGSGVDRGRSIPVLTSRGCPYRCTFCSSPAMWSTRYARRDPERVLDEIEAWVDRYRIDNVDVNDLTALLTKDWILELCAAIERRRLAVSWQLPSGTRSEAVDAEAAEAMFRAGCRNFTYAPESGSERELRRIEKRVDLRALRRSLRAAVRAGIRTHASVIIGMPHEDARDVLESLELLVKLALDGSHTASVMIFAPYPGSSEYDALDAEGRIVHDARFFYGSLLRSAAGSSYHPRWGARRLLAMQLGMLATFFAVEYAVRPWRLAGVARNLAGGRQEIVLEQLLATKARQLARRGRDQSDWAETSRRIASTMLAF